jgi:hypothetical protein
MAIEGVSVSTRAGSPLLSVALVYKSGEDGSRIRKARPSLTGLLASRATARRVMGVNKAVVGQFKLLGGKNVSDASPD